MTTKQTSKLNAQREIKELESAYNAIADALKKITKVKATMAEIEAAELSEDTEPSVAYRRAIKRAVKLGNFERELEMISETIEDMSMNTIHAK